MKKSGLVTILFFTVITSFSQTGNYYFSHHKKLFGRKADILAIEQGFSKDRIDLALVFIVNQGSPNNPCWINMLSFNKNSGYVKSSGTIESSEIFSFHKYLFMKNNKLYLQVSDTCSNKTYRYIFKKKKTKPKKNEIIRGH